MHYFFLKHIYALLNSLIFSINGKKEITSIVKHILDTRIEF